MDNQNDMTIGNPSSLLTEPAMVKFLNQKYSWRQMSLQNPVYKPLAKIFMQVLFI